MYEFCLGKRKKEGFKFSVFKLSNCVPAIKYNIRTTIIKETLFKVKIVDQRLKKRGAFARILLSLKKLLLQVLNWITDSREEFLEQFSSVCCLKKKFQV